MPKTNHEGFKFMRDTIKITDDISNLKIFEIINECFGKSYKGFMKAWYDVNDNYAAWFPTISKLEGMPDGSYGGTKYYSNTISTDGMQIHERNYTPGAKLENTTNQKVFVFGKVKEKQTQVFKFLGLYEYTSRSIQDRYIETVLTRIATGVNLHTFEYLPDDTESEYWPSLDEFNPNISKEKWIELLNDPSVTKPEYMDLLFKVLEQGGESTCAHLWDVYGGSQGAYSAYGRIFGQSVSKKLGIKPSVNAENGRERYYIFPFVGRNVTENGKLRYSWKLRTELREALEEMNLTSAINDKMNDISAFDKNMILYGPPGTGKTYNTAIYAVAICDNISLEEVKCRPYDQILERYNELRNRGRVAFTTFHQSYGYEEFIEGIKPILDGENTDIAYTISDGIFKAFCNQATIPENIEVDHAAKIWNYCRN